MEKVKCKKCGSDIWVSGESDICIQCLTKQSEQKYYTMKDCFDVCGDDDVPFIDVKWNHRDCRTKSEIIRNDFRPSIDNSLSDRWQIKRAEPKVLSACEMRVKTGVIPEIFDGVKQIDDFGEAMDKNGQLREYYRPEQVELREAASGARYAGLDRLEKALENLKPPA